jgi:hypothetical protein
MDAALSKSIQRDLVSEFVGQKKTGAHIPGIIRADDLMETSSEVQREISG